MAALTSSGGGGGSGGGVEMIFNRRIEFHPARKPYSAVSSAGDNGFYLETLNPSASDQKRPHELAFGAESSSSASGKRVEGGAEFYEHGLDQELGFRITFRRIVSGVYFFFVFVRFFVLVLQQNLDKFHRV
jgi:ubiquitin carboxyl-terminal hydrolase 36/42